MSTRSASPSRAALLGMALVVALALPPAGPTAAQSLWSARSGSLVSDLRASRAGDLLTIVVDEQASGSKNADTKLSRDSSFSSSFTPPPFNYPTWLANILNNLRTSGTGQSNYKGSGSTTRTDQASAQLTATVMRVLDNGNLVIEGRRLVVVHDETLMLVVNGLVRPQDVGADNIVRSSSLADGEIRIEGKGGISLRQQPGLLQRLFDWLGLF